MNPSRLSLAPGFSRVSGNGSMFQPFQRLLVAFEKPLERLMSRPRCNTRLKPGANESHDFHLTSRPFTFFAGLQP